MDETTTQDLVSVRRVRVTNAGSVTAHVGYVDCDGRKHEIVTLAPGDERLLAEDDERRLYAWVDSGVARINFEPSPAVASRPLRDE